MQKEHNNERQPNWLESVSRSTAPGFVFNGASRASPLLWGGSYLRRPHPTEQQEAAESYGKLSKFCQEDNSMDKSLGKFKDKNKMWGLGEEKVGCEAQVGGAGQAAAVDSR